MYAKVLHGRSIWQGSPDTAYGCQAKSVSEQVAPPGRCRGSLTVKLPCSVLIRYINISLFERLCVLHAFLVLGGWVVSYEDLGSVKAEQMNTSMLDVCKWICSGLTRNRMPNASYKNSFHDQLEVPLESHTEITEFFLSQGYRRSKTTTGTSHNL